jgi:xanthine dehydrogenase YagR molybdenum-binding subunit
MENLKEQKAIGSPLSRVDGILKITGKATYATDYQFNNIAYAVIFKSTISSGTITNMDTSAAEQAPGVLAVINYKNIPKLNEKGGLRGGSLLQSPEVEFFGQHIGLVVAETFEQATHAAHLVKTTYAQREGKNDFDKLAKNPQLPKDEENKDLLRGDAASAFASAEVKVEESYETPIEHHHPLEPHSTIAAWEGDQLVLYNGSQIINGAQTAAAATLNISPAQVRIVSPYIGGGFGSKGGQWANIALAAVAAQKVGRPVKLTLTRQQMFNSVGLRSRNIQKMSLGATKDGRLLSLAHDTITHGAIKQEFIEPCGDCSKIMYDVANSRITYRVAPMNVIIPTYTRGPGKSTGSFALESAMDELAHKLKMDPIALRIKNEPAKDPSSGKPWSSRTTVQCLEAGAKAFGWDKRLSEPGKNIIDDYYIGYGVACGTYPARQQKSSASILLQNKGGTITAQIKLAAADLGTGTFTILSQVAADGLGLPVENIYVHIGDSLFPPAAGSVGSVGAASYANAVNDACTKITDELIAKSGKQYFVRPSAADVIRGENLAEFETRVDAMPPKDAAKVSSHSFNANFAEVHVNRYTGMVKVVRFLAVTGAGKILNPKTARSQIIGGNVWGIGMALTEESLIDPRYGNFATRSLGDYHVPANLDIPEMDVIFIDEKDTGPNTLGIKGIGEVGIVGVAAAVANAVFNATGKRVRSLPITPDKLL